MKFRDEKPGDNNPDNQPTNEFMKELREMLGRNPSVEEITDEEIVERFGPETLNTVMKVQNRIDELVDAMHGFLEAQDKGIDPSEALLKFTRLMQDTVVRYSPIEVGSMLSAGMTAIAELERRHGKRKPE